MQRWATLLSGDIRRVLGDEWALSVDNELIFTVARGDATERVALDSDVAVDNWPEEAWSPKYHELTLDDDAAEALADEFFEVLRLWGVPGPICPHHSKALLVCGTTWTCPGRPPHDPAQVGSLNA